MRPLCMRRTPRSPATGSLGEVNYPSSSMGEGSDGGEGDLPSPTSPSQRRDSGKRRGVTFEDPEGECFVAMQRHGSYGIVEQP